MKTATSSKPVDAYIGEFPRPIQAILKRVRAALREALPGAEESISYRIPTFKIGGRPVIYFAGFKEHYSVYPFTAALVEAFGKEAARYEVNKKGTIRFSYDQPVPARFIGRIAKFRARQLASGRKSRDTAARKR